MDSGRSYSRRNGTSDSSRSAHWEQSGTRNTSHYDIYDRNDDRSSYNYSGAQSSSSYAEEANEDAGSYVPLSEIRRKRKDNIGSTSSLQPSAENKSLIQTLASQTGSTKQFGPSGDGTIASILNSIGLNISMSQQISEKQQREKEERLKAQQQSLSMQQFGIAENRMTSFLGSGMMSKLSKDDLFTDLRTAQPPAPVPPPSATHYVGGPLLPTPAPAPVSAPAPMSMTMPPPYMPHTAATMSMQPPAAPMSMFPTFSVPPPQSYLHPINVPPPSMPMSVPPPHHTLQPSAPSSVLTEQIQSQLMSIPMQPVSPPTDARERRRQEWMSPPRSQAHSHSRSPVTGYRGDVRRAAARSRSRSPHRFRSESLLSPPRYTERNLSEMDMRRGHGRDVGSDEDRRNPQRPRRERSPFDGAVGHRPSIFDRLDHRGTRSSSMDRKRKHSLDDNFDLDPNGGRKREREPSPWGGLAPPSLSPLRGENRSGPTSESGRRSIIPAQSQPTKIELEAMRRQRDDTNQRLLSVREELERLRRLGSELMRKRQKEKDGHNDPTLTENNVLQDALLRQEAELYQEIGELNRVVVRYEREFNVQVMKVESRDEPIYVYRDAGNYWCQDCNVLSHTLSEVFAHLRSVRHVKKAHNKSSPWAKEKQRPSRRSKMIQAGPIKGVEFLVPSDAFYCQLCEYFCGDTKEAEAHLKSREHHQVYQTHVEKLPTYEQVFQNRMKCELAKKADDEKRDEEKRKLQERLEKVRKQVAVRLKANKIMAGVDSDSQKTTGQTTKKVLIGKMHQPITFVAATSATPAVGGLPPQLTAGSSSSTTTSSRSSIGATPKQSAVSSGQRKVLLSRPPPSLTATADRRQTRTLLPNPSPARPRTPPPPGTEPSRSSATIAKLPAKQSAPASAPGKDTHTFVKPMAPAPKVATAANKQAGEVKRKPLTNVGLPRRIIKTVPQITPSSLPSASATAPTLAASAATVSTESATVPSQQTAGVDTRPPEITDKSETTTQSQKTSELKAVEPEGDFEEFHVVDECE